MMMDNRVKNRRVTVKKSEGKRYRRYRGKCGEQSVVGRAQTFLHHQQYLILDLNLGDKSIFADNNITIILGAIKAWAELITVTSINQR